MTNLHVKRISVTEMAKTLSDVISRVHYKGDTFEISKGKKVVARLVPISNQTITIGDLGNLLSSYGSRMDKEDIQDFEKAFNYSRELKTGECKWD